VVNSPLDVYTADRGLSGNARVGFAAK
jgi:hypothetical protein